MVEVSLPHLQGPVRGRQFPSYPKCSGLMKNGLQGAVQALGKMAWAWMASRWGGDNFEFYCGKLDSEVHADDMDTGMERKREFIPSFWLEQLIGNSSHFPHP